MSKIKIKQAVLSNASDIYKLVCELEKGMDEVDRAKFCAVYSHNVGQDWVVYLLAMEDDRAVGFASMHIQQLLHHGGPVAEVQELIVTDGCRGRGIGKLLLDGLLAAARLSDCCQIEVCCRLWRTKSNEFYGKQGFAKTHYKHVMELVL